MTTQPSERLWWWKIAQHLDEAQLALINAVGLNTDDPAPLIALQDRMRDAQAILFYIFRAKGLMPANGAAEAPKARSAPSAPTHAVPPPGVPMSPPPVAPPGAPMPPPMEMDMPPPPAPSAAGWVPDEAALGAWMPAAPPLTEESAEEPLVASGQNGVTVQPEVSAPASADPSPEA